MAVSCCHYPYKLQHDGRHKEALNRNQDIRLLAVVSLATRRGGPDVKGQRKDPGKP